MRNLDKLKETLQDYGKITILGHDNIDVDAFLSAILLSRLLNFIGIENEFIILEKVHKNETFDIIKDMFNIDMREYQCNVEDSSRKLFLEDHYSTKHKGKVIACLDHHLTSDPIVNSYLFYYCRQSCSVSYIVYELMCEAGYQICKEEAKMILVSMMVDTVAFKSKKTVKAEVTKAKEIAKQFKLNFQEIEKCCLCLTPIDKLSTEEIIENGFKDYNYNGNKVKSSYIQVYEMLDEEVIDDWINLIVQKLKSQKLSMWVFVVFVCKDEITIEYHITSNSINRIKTVGILSRGINIMPKIEEYFTNL